jgi:HEAT repeat protein
MSAGSEPDDLAPLLQTLREGGTEERRAAIRALADRGAQAAPAAADLVQLLGSSKVSLREEAARALTRIGRPAVAALVEALHTEDPDLRKAIVVTLAALGPEAGDAEPVLRELREDPWVGPWAAEALAQIHGQRETTRGSEQAARLGVLIAVLLVVAVGLLCLAAQALSMVGLPRAAFVAGLALAVLGAGMGPVLGYQSWSGRKTVGMTIVFGVGGGVAGLVLGSILGGMVEPLARVLGR